MIFKIGKNLIKIKDGYIGISDREPEINEWYYDSLDTISSKPIYFRSQSTDYGGCNKILFATENLNLEGVPILDLKFRFDLSKASIEDLLMLGNRQRNEYWLSNTYIKEGDYFIEGQPLFTLEELNKAIKLSKEVDLDSVSELYSKEEVLEQLRPTKKLESIQLEWDNILISHNGVHPEYGWKLATITKNNKDYVILKFINYERI